MDNYTARKLKILNRIFVCLIFICIYLVWFKVFPAFFDHMSEKKYEDCTTTPTYTKYENTLEIQKRFTDLSLNKDYQQMLTLADQLLEEDPQNVQAIFSKADAHYHLNNHADCLKYLYQAKEASPGWAYILNPYIELVEERLNSE